ncbi:MAG: RNA polymerase sigma factor [Minisyncoccia bacterium]
MNEKELIEVYLKKNDEKALALLINKYLKTVYLYFLKRTNNNLAAEDLTQETFVKMWRNLKKFDLKKNFKTWLFTIAKNTFIDYLKKYYYQNGQLKETTFSILESKNTSDTTAFLEDIIDEKSLVLEAVEQKEKVRQLEEFFQNFSLADRQLILKRQEGFKFEELAKQFKTSVNTIKTRYYRLIKKLQKKLNI